MTWHRYRDWLRGADVVVIGNGPSRLTDWPAIGTRPDGSRRQAVGCNGAGWDLGCEWVVCYDESEVAYCLDRDPARSVLLSRLPIPGTVPIDPHDAAGIAGDLSAWGGPAEAAAVGNLSGYLALQAALLLGAARIILCGLDVGGIRSHDGRVRLSAVDPSEAAYAHQWLPGGACEPCGQTLLPSGWRVRVGYWRALTDWAAARGVEVTRSSATSAMDWLPVHGASTSAPDDRRSSSTDPGPPPA